MSLFNFSTKQRITKFAIQRNSVYITRFVIQRNSVLRNQLRNLQFNETTYILRDLQFNEIACYEINVTMLSNFEQFLIQLFNLYDKLYDNQTIDLKTFSKFSSYFKIFKLNTK